MSALGHHKDSIADLAALNSSAKLKADRSYTTDDVDRLSRVHDGPIVVKATSGSDQGPHGDDFSNDINETVVYEQAISYPSAEAEMPRSAEPDPDLTAENTWGQSEYDDDYYDDFDLTLYNENKDMMCCLFPWTKREEDESDSDDDVDNTSVPISRFTQKRASFQNKPGDGKLYAAKRQPSFGSINDNSDDDKAPSEDEKKVDTSDNNDGYTNNSTPPPHTVKPKKSILRRTSAVMAEPPRGLNKTDDSKKSRRSLFTNAYDQTSKRHAPTPHRVQFSPMARVTYITSCSQMSLLFKSFIWWQKSDFEDFKKTARIIAKAMLTGGSEIWLQTSNAWHVPRKQQQQQRRGSLSAINNEDDEGDDNDVGHKWWCKFGHSRRGLEHIVSMDEGKQRQENVALAIAAVMDEQRRQRLTNRSDPDRLANISSRYTSWARDLALAAGLADADSVRQKFGPNAKPRSYYLEAVASHSAAAWQMVTSSGGRHLSVDVLTKSLTDSELSPTVLDMNTRSGPMRANFTRTDSARRSFRNHSGSEEDIHGKANISKKAAGFGSGVTDGIDRNLLVQRRLVTSNS